MFKLLKNLFSREVQQNNTAVSESDVSDWKAQLTQADRLWEQGQIDEALAVYNSTIKNNPNLSEIQQRLAGRIKQQGELAVAYEKLAVGLKNKGKIEQAANYYRQAINLKALTGNTKNQLLRSSIVPLKKNPIPIASLKEAAFSFQPLTNNTAIVKVTSSPPTSTNLQDEFDSLPQFSSRVKSINPQQARDIDWETAQVYFQKALEHLEKQEWEHSALACKQATQIMPDMAEAYKIWGNALQRMGETGEAMACYAKAVEIKPNLAEVYAGIADIYIQQAKWQQAIEHYQKAIIIKPNAKTHRKLAAAWQKVGEVDKAEFNLYQAKELELSENSSTQESVQSALAKIDRNNIDGAITIYCQVAKQLERQNQWQEAAKYYRQALDLSMSRLALPPSKSAQAELETSPADSLITPPRQASSAPKTPISQWDRAIRRYHKQAKLQPNSPKIYTDLGNLYAKKGKFTEAIICYRQAIKLNRQYAKAHLNLARALLKTKKQPEFIKEMQLALALQPRIGTAIDRFYLGNALAEENQDQQAISFYCKAVALDPHLTSAYHRLSELLSHQGKDEQAIAFLEQAIAQNPQNAESYYLLGQYWEQQSNWDKAVKTYGQVLEIEPKYPQASKRLNHALAEKLKLKRQPEGKSQSRS
ncbi:MAG: tetratricopeptide repeat protein [Cyanobacteria bacterium J06600_6]